MESHASRWEYECLKMWWLSTLAVKSSVLLNFLTKIIAVLTGNEHFSWNEMCRQWIKTRMIARELRKCTGTSAFYCQLWRLPAMVLMILFAINRCHLPFSRRLPTIFDSTRVQEYQIVKVHLMRSLFRRATIWWMMSQYICTSVQTFNVEIIISYCVNDNGRTP